MPHRKGWIALLAGGLVILAITVGGLAKAEPRTPSPSVHRGTKKCGIECVHLKVRRPVVSRGTRKCNINCRHLRMAGRVAYRPKPGKKLVRTLQYRHFDSCLPAVKYLFAGRWDLSRALFVVRRESHYDPNAISSDDVHVGCGQLSSGMRKAFLQGSWRDPYQNVLAMRRAIDRWGWCHWDIVNYCSPGGDW